MMIRNINTSNGAVRVLDIVPAKPPDRKFANCFRLFAVKSSSLCLSAETVCATNCNFEGWAKFAQTRFIRKYISMETQ